MSDGSQLDVDPRISAIVRALRDFGHLSCNQGGWRSAGLADFIINEADAADRAAGYARVKLDPPKPQWLADAVNTATTLVGQYEPEDRRNEAEAIVGAVLPIISAGVEAELRERLAAQVSSIIYEAPMVIGRPARLFERAFAAILGVPPAA